MYHKRLTFNIPEQEHILNTHTDQLAQWYADAERITDTNLPRIGDTLIFPYNAGGYAIEAEGDDWTPGDVVPGEPVRILSRAPKPKPAWHDAPAVIATYRDERGMVSGAWVREGKPGYWEGPEGDVVASEALEDVVPLIEAKVTDEMVERATRAVINWEYRPRLDTTITLDLGDKGSRALVNSVLTAALGLETE